MRLLFFSCLIFFLSQRQFSQSDTARLRLNSILKIQNAEEKKGSVKVFTAAQIFSDHQLALEGVNHMLQLSADNRISNYYATALNWKGLTLYYLGKGKEALSYYDSSLAIASLLKDTLLLIKASGNKGLSFERSGEFAKAFAVYSKAAFLAAQIQNKQLLASGYGNLGNVCQRMNNFRKSADYLFQAINILKSINDNWRLANQYNSVAMVYKEMKKEDSAVYYLKMAEKIYRELNDPTRLSTTLQNLATIEKDHGNYSQALNLFEEALKLKKSSGDDINLGVILVNVALLNDKMQNRKRALELLQEAEKLAMQNEERELLVEVLLRQAGIFKQTGQIQKAYDLMLEYISVKDSLMGEKSREAVAKYQEQFESGKKEIEIERLKKADLLKELELKNSMLEIKEQRANRNRILWLLGLAILIIFVAAWGFIQKRKSNRALELKNQQIELKNQQLTQAFDEIQLRKDEVELKNKEILDSIRYAKRIQQSLITQEKYIQHQLKRLRQ